MKRQVSRRRIRRGLAVAATVVVGAPTLLILGLLAWDGGFALGRDRVLLPGVELHLRTAATKLGQVEYDMYGEEGPVVLSIHAGLGGADQGRLFASWLQAGGFRILSPSRPGYLGTPLTSGRTLQEQADLLAALLDELDISKVGLLAASAGAPVAYTFAARYPEKAWGLVSIGGVSLPKQGKASGPSIRATFMNTIGQKLVKLTANISLETIVDGTLSETSSFTSEQKAQRSAYITNTPQVRTFFEAMLSTTLPYSQRTPGTDNDAAQARAMGALPLGQIKAPSLIIHGTHDADVPYSEGVHAYERIPGARHYRMDRDDHLGFWLGSQAETAQGIARTFLLRHVPEPR